MPRRPGATSRGARVDDEVGSVRHRTRRLRRFRVRRRVGAAERAHRAARRHRPPRRGQLGDSDQRRRRRRLSPPRSAPSTGCRLHPGALDARRLPRRRPDRRGPHPRRRARKVVLARDLVGHVPEGADLRRVLLDLALGYPDTWTFAVDGLLGSSPETLVRVNARHRDGAGARRQRRRGKDADADRRRRRTRTRDLVEGSRRAPLRRQSVLDALRPHARDRGERAAVHPQAAEPVAPRERRRGHALRRLDGARPRRRAAPDRRGRRHADRQGARA